MRLNLPDWLYVVRDFIFPMRQPLSSVERADEEDRKLESITDSNRRIRGLSGTDLADRLADIRALLASEDDRRKSVDGRLTATLGLTSIAGTVVFGTILARSESIRPDGTILRYSLALGSLYLALQVICAIHAAVRGLSRRGYPMTTVADVLPMASEPSWVHLRRQLVSSIEALYVHYAENNEKVTQMAITHAAMRNFSFGLIFLAVVGTIQIWTLHGYKAKNPDQTGVEPTSVKSLPKNDGTTNDPAEPGVTPKNSVLEPGLPNVPVKTGSVRKSGKNRTVVPPSKINMDDVRVKPSPEPKQK